MLDLSEILKNISLILASSSVIYGVVKWRIEFVGKRRIELTEEALALFYEAGDAIRRMRSPMGFQGEGQTRKPGDDESSKEKKILDDAYVIIERFNNEKEIFSKIHAMRYRYMTQFGKDKVEPFEEIHRIINDILFSSTLLGRYRLQEYRGAIKEKDRQKFFEKIEKEEGLFWEGLLENDPILPRLKKAISLIEKDCSSQISI